MTPTSHSARLHHPERMLGGIERRRVTCTQCWVVWRGKTGRRWLRHSQPPEMGYRSRGECGRLFIYGWRRTGWEWSNETGWIRDGDWRRVVLRTVAERNLGFGRGRTVQMEGGTGITSSVHCSPIERQALATVPPRSLCALRFYRQDFDAFNSSLSTRTSLQLVHQPSSSPSNDVGP